MSTPAPDPVPTPIDAASYRRAVGRFATGVCVVTAVVDGMKHAMTANSFTSVSLEPPQVLVCVAQDARFHDAILDSGAWAVSVLDATARPVASWLATPGRPLHGQLDRVAHRPAPITGAPWLSPALAWLECRTSQVVTAGDHSVVIADVISWELAADSPPALVYFRSTYGTLD